MGILRQHDDGELAGLRAELAAERDRAKAACEAQRRADETGWSADGRWSRPGRQARDRIGRGDDHD